MSWYFRNAGIQTRHYTVVQPRRQQPEFSSHQKTINLKCMLVVTFVLRPRKSFRVPSGCDSGPQNRSERRSE